MVEGGVIRIKIIPDEGWGFAERDFGNLAEPFEADVKRVGRSFLIVKYGWRGTVCSIGHRYEGRSVVLTPRHDPFSGWVVIRVFDGEVAIGAETLFDGMADTVGLM